MSDALSRYYNNGDPLGIDGDFTTAPEISQLFGEIIGIWVVQKWFQMGSPSSFNLIELGPGRGTLMMDLLRATNHIHDFQKAACINLVETSDSLKQKQKQLLGIYSVQWHEHLSNISPEKPAIIIANEFFDALPVRQFKFTKEWQECYIDQAEIKWVKVQNPPIKPTLKTQNENDIFEYSSAQKNYAELMASYKGFGLIIDYGYKKSNYGDSLQALYKHKSCKITEHVGEADLTTHVDFEWLGSFFKNAEIKNQSDFLKENGISIRYRQLNNLKLKSGYNRLLDSNQMGQLFKAMIVNL